MSFEEMRAKKYETFLGKIMGVLELFAMADLNLGVTEVSSKLSIPKSTASRLLRTLEANGYLERDELGRKYKLGKKAFVLAANLLSKLNIREIALSTMVKIRDLTGETVILSILVEEKANEGPGSNMSRVVLDFVVGNRELVHLPKLGKRTPLYAGASSKAILAFLPTEKIEKVLSEPLVPLSSRTITDVEELRKELCEIRLKGYATSFCEREEGVAGIAAPIWDYRGKVVGSLSVGIPSIRAQKIEISGLAELVKKGAEEISEMLRSPESKI